MPADQEVLQVAALQEGAVYCVKAKVVLNLDVQSGFTDSHCVSITGTENVSLFGLTPETLNQVNQL